MTAATAYILAGGGSSRFGSDKARALLSGGPLILRLARALRAFAWNVVVVAEMSEKYRDLGLETIRDERLGLGPIGGLLTLLRREREQARLVPVLACDQLDHQPAIWRALLAASDDAADAVVFRDRHWQPWPGLYRPTLLGLLESRVAAGKLSMQGLLDQACVAPVAWEGAAVAHANTAAELAVFQERLQEFSPPRDA